MATRRLFLSVANRDIAVEVSCANHGVALTTWAPDDLEFDGAFAVIDPDDIPALIAELRRVAKLVKEARDSGDT